MAHNLWWGIAVSNHIDIMVSDKPYPISKNVRDV